MGIGDKGEESGNIDSLFRERIQQYFTISNRDTNGLQESKVATQKGHVHAQYIYGMILLCSYDHDVRQQWLLYVRSLRKFKCVMKCRNKFGEAQRTLVALSSSSSIDSFVIFGQAPFCCFLRHLSSQHSPATLRLFSGDPPILLCVEKLGTMSAVFEGYERQYCELSANLSRQCTAASALDGEQKKQKLSDIKAELDDADTLIRKMDLEARSLQPSTKATLLAKLREYKTDLNNLKTEVKRVTSTNVSLAARHELLESGETDTLAVSNDQKGRLLMSTERLNQSSDRIKDSRRTMLETEELGVSILQDLHQQRQSLLHAHNSLQGVDDNISKSKKILSAMSRRMSRNKWIVGSLMTALVLAIIIILYFKLTH
ncbi:hypothetical protein VNO78_02867 [Psophocarpus tetragonolobus]|uniref:Vesicle transport v-SNARE N-terminal domain-containing protein n=1 Tax=Psophocarpus tetragonolobus TaxID=3891 RepID=A0AAN9XWE8_PSOTE